MHIPDIYHMEAITLNQSQTKLCPFCAEMIQVQAIKCRFCGEFLNTNRAKAAEQNSQSGQDKASDNILFEGRPSLWAMVGAAIKGLIFLALAAFLIYYPIEDLPMFQPVETDQNPTLAEYTESAEELPESELVENPVPEESTFGLTEAQAVAFARYRVIAGIGLAALVVLILLMKILWLKMTHYEVSADRIEYSRGILDRRVDNLDMFRVLDLKLRRSLLDCIVGVGTVGLITTDKTDPEFTFKKIRNSRRLYDIIKKASLDADRRSSVIHLE